MTDWTTHNGTERPVGEDTLVEVKFRDGEQGKAVRAKRWDWVHKGQVDDIVEYRVISETCQNDGS